MSELCQQPTIFAHRQSILDYQRQHRVDGLEALPVSEISSEGQRTDSPDIIRDQCESTAGTIHVDGKVASFTLAAAPHTSISLLAEDARVFLQGHQLDGEKRNVIFPKEYSDGVPNTDLIGKDLRVPAHMVTFMWDKSDPNKPRDITTAEIGGLSYEEQDIYWRMWQECLRVQMNIYKEQYNSPIWRELNGIPGSEELSTEDLLRDMTPTIHLTGFYPQKKQLETGLIRGSQSIAPWHASTLSLPYPYLDYEVKPVTPDEVYKQISPFDEFIFRAMRGMMEGDIAHEGYLLRSEGNTYRSSAKYPHHRPSYEGIETYGLLSTNSMATVDVPFTLINHIVASDIHFADRLYSKGLMAFQAYHMYMGYPEMQQYVKDLYLEKVKEVWNEKIRRGFEPVHRLEEVLHTMECTVFHTFKPTYRQVVTMLSHSDGLGEKTRQYLQQLEQKYSFRAQQLQDHRTFNQMRAIIAGDTGLHYNGQVALLEMIRDQVMDPSATGKPITPKKTMPGNFSATLLYNLGAPEKNKPYEDIMVRRVAIDPGCSYHGAAEVLTGGVIRRPEAKP